MRVVALNSLSLALVSSFMIQQDLRVGSSGVVYAVKLYPAGATTNSQEGVTDIFGKCFPVLEEMVKQKMPLLVYSLNCTLDKMAKFELLFPCLTCSFLYSKG
ncbi:dihydroorotase, mitochondrial-like, partial [Phalaenopsis equestris]|uniref:dihydroorotase, mitochondrial-like n=1 Tax=Phalaenopsis equestris TaxID=78828 RepID=UPI0009E2E688